MEAPEKKQENIYSMNNTTVTPPLHPKNSWLTITLTGMTIGMTLAATTYTVGSLSTNTASNATGLALDALDDILSIGTDALLGPISAISVKLASRIASTTAKESVQTGGTLATTILAGVVGAAAALTISIGSHVFYYTIDYGGQLTSELAQKIAEIYLIYKAKCLQQTGFSTILSDEDWILLEPEESSESSTSDTVVEEEGVTPINAATSVHNSST